MEVDLLRDIDPRPPVYTPDCSPQISYQKALADLREMALRVRKNALTLDLGQPITETREVTTTRKGQLRVEDVACNFHWYRTGDHRLYVEYSYPKEDGGPQDWVTVLAKKNELSLVMEIDRLESIDITIAKCNRERVSLNFSVGKTDPECDVRRVCPERAELYTATPKDTDLIKEVTAMVSNILS